MRVFPTKDIARMQRPNFNVDGRTGQLKGIDPHGKTFYRSGRVSFLWKGFLEAVLAGTAGSEGHMALTESRMRGGELIWHRVHVTPDEARDALAAMKLGGRSSVVRCERIRVRRVERGLPVANPEWKP